MNNIEMDYENVPLGRVVSRLSVSEKLLKNLSRENKPEANGSTSYPFFYLRSSRSSVVQSLILKP